MSELKFKTIHTNINQFNDQIDRFLESLDSEKKYFVTLNKEMILHSDLIIAAIDQDRIIGMTGMVPRFFFHKTWIIVKDQYQGKGVGGFLYFKRNAEAKKRFNLIVSNIHPDNSDSLNLNYRFGARNLGMRFGIQYMAIVYNKKGIILFYLFKALLPIINLWDRFKNLFACEKSKGNV